MPDWSQWLGPGARTEAAPKVIRAFQASDPVTDAQHVKVEVNRKGTGSRYELKTYLGISMLVMARDDMFAHKLMAMHERVGKTSRDVYDVWFLLNRGAVFSLKDTNKKLKRLNLSFKVKLMIEKIEDKKSSWESDLRGLILGSLPPFNIVKKEIIEKFQNR